MTLSDDDLWIDDFLLNDTLGSTTYFTRCCFVITLIDEVVLLYSRAPTHNFLVQSVALAQKTGIQYKKYT